MITESEALDEKQQPTVPLEQEVAEVKEDTRESIEVRRKNDLIKARNANFYALFKTDTISAAALTVGSGIISFFSLSTSAVISGSLSVATSMHYPHKLEDLKREISKKIEMRDDLREELSEAFPNLDELVKETKETEAFGANNKNYTRIFVALLAIQGVASILMAINMEEKFIPSENVEPYILPFINFVASAATLIVHSCAFLNLQNNASEYDVEIDILKRLKKKKEEKEENEAEDELNELEIDYLQLDEEKQKLQTQLEVTETQNKDKVKNIEDEYFKLFEKHNNEKSSKKRLQKKYNKLEKSHEVLTKSREALTKTNETLSMQLEAESNKLLYANSQIELLRSRIRIYEPAEPEIPAIPKRDKSYYFALTSKFSNFFSHFKARSVSSNSGIEIQMAKTGRPSFEP